MMTKKEAEKLGRALLKRMEGKGWKLRVWENLVWHYCVYIENTMSVYEHFYNNETTYSCLLGGTDHGEMIWDHSEILTDPNQAVQHQVKLAEETLAAEVSRLQGIIDRAKEAIYGKPSR